MNMNEDKYNAALERAKKELQSCGPRYCDAARRIFKIFPELQESEDENIRKDLIEWIDDFPDPVWRGHHKKNIIVWLEKQKDVSSFERVFRPMAGCDITDAAAQAIKQQQLGYKVVLVFNGAYIPVEEKTTDDIVNEYNSWLEKQTEPTDKGEISDGYHTFNELYYYRMLYNAAFFNLLPKEIVHKSKKHHDGEECFGGGWFIVMANLPTGQISNHYELKDWDLFQIPEKDVADEWDGHTPQEAAERLHKYLLEKRDEQLVEPKWCHHKVDLSAYSEEYRKAYYDGWNNCNMQHTQCKSEMQDVMKCLIHGMKYLYEDNKDASWGTDKWHMPVRHIIEVLEKQVDVKKPDNKPKFKVGDWIVFNGLTVYIYEIVDGYYKTVDIDDIPCSYDWAIDNIVRLWTIQDAKDGDVLCYETKDDFIIFIYKNGHIHYHCCYYNGHLTPIDSFFVIDKYLLNYIHPATKEQCDLLFRKIKEAGYVWDGDKKQLKMSKW